MCPCILVRRFRLPIGTLVLLLAVVGWGLQYKTSLYPQANHRHAAAVIPAKLLNDGETSLTWNDAIPSTGSVLPIGLASPDAIATGYHREPERSEGHLCLVSQKVPREQRPDARFFLRGPPRL